MNLQRLLQDYSIPHVTQGEHSRATPGWVNVHCPFCPGKKDYHLGLHQDGGAGHCWRCGTYPVKKALAKILNLSESETLRIMREYGGKPGRRRVKEDARKVSIHPFRLPQPNSLLTPAYKRYLAQRDFDPEKLEHEWDLRQTGPASMLDGISYSHRILIPIHWNGEPVSFQARDVTGRSDRKYLACPRRREKVNHQTILYGKQKAWEQFKGIIVVEGVTDVWRLGRAAAATFGTQVRTEQILQLARHNDRFFIVFDPETQAQRTARKVASKLRALGKEAHVIKIYDKDPGSMEQSEANLLVRDLVGRLDFSPGIGYN